MTPEYLDALAAPGEALVVELSSGQRVSSTAGRADEDDLSAGAPLDTGGRLTLFRDSSVVGSQVSRAILPLAMLGLLLALLAAVAGFVLARRLARPFQALAAAARGLGAGRFHPDIPDSPVPEAREIGRALTTAGAQLDALLEHERELRRHASHELRTPVTALRLDLEDLALWPETAPSVAAELQRSVTQLDRLATAISELLERSHARQLEASIDLDLDALVADTVAGLSATSAVAAVNRVTGPAPTRLDPAPVVRALQMLVDEAGTAGADRVELSVVTHPGHYEVRVSDSSGSLGSSGRRASDAPGWADVRQAATDAGGQLSRDSTALVLRLPRRELAGSQAGTGPASPAGAQP